MVLYDLEYNEIQRWNFFRAFPCRWVGPKLDCKMRDTLAVERIEIAHEGLELDDAYASDSSGDSFWSKFADGVQASLDIAGLIPGVGEIADGVNKFKVTITYLDPETQTLEEAICIIPHNSVDYYTIQADGVKFQALSLEFKEL